MGKSCPRCGNSFVCQPESVTSCQCSSAKLDNLQRSYVKLYYAPQCLCISCLEEIKQYFYVCEVNPRYRKSVVPNDSSFHPNY